MPQTTEAITPENPKCSHIAYTSATSSTLIRICLTGSRVSFINWPSRKDTARATTNAPITSFSITTRKLLPPLRPTILLKNTKSATPVPSLKSDSLSITEVTFLDSPSLFKMPVAAMGSVGETMQPSRMHTHISTGTWNNLAAPQNSTPYRREESTVVNSASRLMALRF